MSATRFMSETGVVMTCETMPPVCPSWPYPCACTKAWAHLVLFFDYADDEHDDTLGRAVLARLLTEDTTDA